MKTRPANKRQTFYERLYQFHIYDWKGQAIVYSLTMILALAYAIVSDVFFRRSAKAVVVEMIIFTIALLFILTIAYALKGTKLTVKEVFSEKALSKYSDFITIPNAIAFPSLVGLVAIAWISNARSEITTILAVLLSYWLGLVTKRASVEAMPPAETESLKKSDQEASGHKPA